MPDYLKDWPNESEPEKELLILQCHKANIAVEMAVDNGLGGRKDLVFLQTCIHIIGDRLDNAFGLFEKILKADTKDPPRWTLLALGLVSGNDPPFENVRTLLNTNARLLQQITATSNERAKLKNLADMSRNFTEIQAHLRGNRWPGPSKPRTK